jgi:excisionase family DNA binding protein
MEQNSSAVVSTAPPIVGQVYTTEEVGKMLKVSQRTVQDWVRSGVLVAVRYGRLLRIREADLAAFGEVLNQRPPRPSAPAALAAPSAPIPAPPR